MAKADKGTDNVSNQLIVVPQHQEQCLAPSIGSQLKIFQKKRVKEGMEAKHGGPSLQGQLGKWRQKVQGLPTLHEN